MKPPPGAMPPPPDAEPRTDWNETVIAVGKGDEGFDVSPNGRELWTANSKTARYRLSTLRPNT